MTSLFRLNLRCLVFGPADQAYVPHNTVGSVSSASALCFYLFSVFRESFKVQSFKSYTTSRVIFWTRLKHCHLGDCYWQSACKGQHFSCRGKSNCFYICEVG